MIDILMYHSISDAGGPTSIPPTVFRAQMTALAESGVPVLSMDDVAAGATPPRAAVVTFDDGFRDFADTAWPILAPLGIRPIVYLATGHVGGAEAWGGANTPARPLVDWGAVRELAAAGVAFGSHTVTHPALDTLAPAAVESELRRSQETLEDRLGRSVRHFAPPYGRTTRAVRARIAARYATSVGTRLGRAGPGADLVDLPRIEMFYFRAERRWRAHLTDRGAGYLAARKALRALRDRLQPAWRRT